MENDNLVFMCVHYLRGGFFCRLFTERTFDSRSGLLNTLTDFDMYYFCKEYTHKRREDLSGLCFGQNSRAVSI